MKGWQACHGNVVWRGPTLCRTGICDLGHLYLNLNLNDIHTRQHAHYRFDDYGLPRCLRIWRGGLLVCCRCS